MSAAGWQASLCITLKPLAIILEELMKQGRGSLQTHLVGEPGVSLPPPLSRIMKTSSLSSLAKGSLPPLSCYSNICAGIHSLLVLLSGVATVKLGGGPSSVRRAPPPQNFTGTCPIPSYMDLNSDRTLWSNTDFFFN